MNMPVFTKTSRLQLVVLLLLLACAAGGCAGSKARRTRDQKVQTIIGTARSYTGTPYRWGGTTKAGMDCSGLLVTSFKSAGIALPRTAKEQSKTGKKVDLNQLKPGDLVFFSRKPRRRKVTHAGLVTRVVGKKDVRFIHASTSQGVIEANLFSDYYKKRIVKARRPF